MRLNESFVATKAPRNERSNNRSPEQTRFSRRAYGKIQDTQCYGFPSTTKPGKKYPAKKTIELTHLDLFGRKWFLVPMRKLRSHPAI